MSDHNDITKSMDNSEKADDGCTSSEDEHHAYKIFKKYTIHDEDSKPSDFSNKGHLHESKLLSALSMYTKKALL